MDSFNVVLFFPDGSYTYEGCGLRLQAAVELSQRVISRKPGRMLGIIARVIITDADDCTVFDWRDGKGIVWPNKEDARPENWTPPNEQA